jgi:hypothetical protein
MDSRPSWHGIAQGCRQQVARSELVAQASNLPHRIGHTRSEEVGERDGDRPRRHRLRLIVIDGRVLLVRPWLGGYS